jgi:hypothetical protein
MSKFNSYNYLSEADLEKLDCWTPDLPYKNPTLFKQILFKHGAEITKTIELVEDTHRMRTSNKTHTGKRWVFIERIDRDWLNSGAASMEAWMASADKETQKDMSSMSRYVVTYKKGSEEMDE